MRPVSPLVWKRLAWKRIAHRPWRLSPPMFLASGFGLLILLGTLLLKIPAFHRGSISWLDALFTATSSVCITGLTTIDIGDQLTLYGQLVCLTLMQLGGIGIMTFAALTLMLFGKGNIRLGYQQLVSDPVNKTKPKDLIWLLKRVAVLVFGVEAICMVLFAVHWVPQLGWSEGLYHSFFHAVSAFNNVGFTLASNSLQNHQLDTLLVLVTSVLIIVGGLGFMVVNDIWRRRHWQSLALHSKLTLLGTVCLLTFGFIALTAIEWSNSSTLGAMSFTDKLINGWFLGVTPRTSGFSTVDIGQLQNASLVIVILLMFIGAGTNSTGGGIKVSTMMVLLLATYAFLTGKKQPVIFGRSISMLTVFKALAVTFITLLFIILGLLALTLTDPDKAFVSVLLEVVAAITTTGLSLNLTQQLSDAGQLVLVPLMFIGRLGPLTLAFLLTRSQKSRVEFAEGEVFIG